MNNEYYKCPKQKDIEINYTISYKEIKTILNDTGIYKNVQEMSDIIDQQIIESLLKGKNEH